MSFRISSRFIRVWQRNLTVYQESWKINFMPPLLEPPVIFDDGGVFDRISTKK